MSVRSKWGNFCLTDRTNWSKAPFKVRNGIQTGSLWSKRMRMMKMFRTTPPSLRK